MSDCCYTAFEKVRQNITKGSAPYEPKPDYGPEDRGLKATALRFLHERCVGLRFDPAKDAEFAPGAAYTGKSLRGSTIPYNMERDIDRLCLERSLGDFLDSGTTEDAYTVYYCFLDMFLGGYEKHRRLIENLSEYERNGSSLLTKHRDHYVHSVYVFALGLAVYESNSTFRKALADFYPEIGEKAGKPEQVYAHFFLEYWGLCALFHDIGYPFELPFEQIMAYYYDLTGDGERKNCPGPYLAYRNTVKYTKLSPKVKQKLAALYGEEFSRFSDVLAHAVTSRLGKAYALDRAALGKLISRKPEHPEEYNMYMDHAYFSALRLFNQLTSTEDDVQQLNTYHFDVLSAILMHNSLFKFSIARDKDGKPKEALRMTQHPFAFLLMFCDELQCWDRVAYGRQSRWVQYPYQAVFDFSDGKTEICYLYHPDMKEAIQEHNDAMRAWEHAGRLGKPPRLKPYGDMGENNKFLHDIRELVNFYELSPRVTTEIKAPDHAKARGTLSRSSYLHLYDYAVTLHTLSHDYVLFEDRRDLYRRQSLEYQLSGINRAKAFAAHLAKIGCFYSDRPNNLEEVTAFSAEDGHTIAVEEHGRWLREHQKMGWRQYNGGSASELEKNRRELLRCHPLMMEGELSDDAISEHYTALPPEEQKKDILPFERLQELLKDEDGVRIYRFPGKAKH